MANSVHDVAAYILEKCGTISAMKLQKLVYYSQAWSLVWDERALFDERIEAWANGPVVPELYAVHRGQFTVNTWVKGNASLIGTDARETIDAVIRDYGSKSAQWLSDLTHMEDPWRKARRGCAPDERCSAEISKASLAEYYGSLPPDANFA
jgi:uncharacterized phage-associated protein